MAAVVGPSKPADSFEELFKNTKSEEGHWGVNRFSIHIDADGSFELGRISGGPSYLRDILKYTLRGVLRGRDLFGRKEQDAEQAVLGLLGMIEELRGSSNLKKVARYILEIYQGQSDAPRDIEEIVRTQQFTPECIYARKRIYALAYAEIKDYQKRYPETVSPVLERELSLSSPATVAPIIGSLGLAKTVSLSALEKVFNIFSESVKKGPFTPAIDFEGTAVGAKSIRDTSLSYLKASGDLLSPYLPRLFELALHGEIPDYLGDFSSIWGVVSELIEVSAKGGGQVQEHIKEAFEHDDLKVQTMAMIALWEVDSPNEEFLNNIERFLDSDNSYVKNLAVSSLGRFASRAERFIPKLKEIAEEASYVSAWSFSALGQIIDPNNKSDVEYILDKWKGYGSWVEPVEPDSIAASMAVPQEVRFKELIEERTVAGLVRALGALALRNDDVHAELLKACRSDQEIIREQALVSALGFKNLEDIKPFTDFVINQPRTSVMRRLDYIVKRLLDFGPEGRDLLRTYRSKLQAELELIPVDNSSNWNRNLLKREIDCFYPLDESADKT